MIPPSASEHLVIELKILLTQMFHYKFFEQDIWYYQERTDLEYYIFSNQTTVVDTFSYEQVGLILEKLNLTIKYQIILQCGYNFTGEILTEVFNYTGERMSPKHHYL